MNFCEYDKYATKSYCAIHNVDESLNLGDITQVDERKLKDFNMMTWGFPCTDISVTGKQKGFLDEDGQKTRSGMYYEGIRILRAKKPALSIIENVKNLTGKKFKSEFEMVLNDLDDAGYNSYYRVLNAKNYGVPQNRERVFIVSIRKDLDNGKFKFPEPFDNGIRLKDILENDVDEKYYLPDEKVEQFLENLHSDTKRIKEPCVIKDSNANELLNGLQNEITESNSVKQLGNIVNTGNWDNPQRGRIYSPNGCSPTLNTCGGGGLEPKILQVGKMCDGIRIRKLVPLECFRLMGFSDKDFYAAKDAGISDSQLYKQSGNSIVVDVLYYIYVELYKAMPYLFDDLKLSSFFSGIGAFETGLDRLYDSINTGNFTRPQVE